jgi:pimeloyl-ACP methyl ester carboxylesterase
MDRRTFATLCAGAAGHSLLFGRSKADEVSSEFKDNSTGPINALAPTLGGRQFWADELFFHEWHIQRNSLTGHCRLLDGANLRHAWGSFEQCSAKLEQIKARQQLPPMSGAAVVVLHGLFRSASSMRFMGRHLREQGNYAVFNVCYPTTRGTVAEHAARLSKIIDRLDGIEQLHFVAHSLGNLVVRHYLGDHTDAARGFAPDARINRMVMLGPPNQGAQMAEAFADLKLFHVVAGASASQLAREWKDLESKLITPACEFGILAGGRGTVKGYNPLLGVDNDMVVTVESTRLAGAADFAVLPVLHTLMMDDPTVQQYTLRFLRSGYFISEAERRPIDAGVLR